MSDMWPWEMKKGRCFWICLIQHETTLLNAWKLFFFLSTSIGEKKWSVGLMFSVFYFSKQRCSFIMTCMLLPVCSLSFAECCFLEVVWSLTVFFIFYFIALSWIFSSHSKANIFNVIWGCYFKMYIATTKKTASQQATGKENVTVFLVRYMR